MCLLIKLHKFKKLQKMSLHAKKKRRIKHKCNNYVHYLARVILSEIPGEKNVKVVN